MFNWINKMLHKLDGLNTEGVINVCARFESRISNIEKYLLDKNKNGSLDRISEFVSKDEPIMSPEERKNYVADVSVVFEKVLKPKIEKLIYQQKEYIASKGLKDEFEFDRGTMNGILTVFEEFERDHLEHLDNVKPKEEFDKYEVMNELLK